MACIVCLAAIAAVMFTAGVSVEEWMSSRLEKAAASGKTTRETDSVVTWRGEFPLVLDDGGDKVVRATIHLFKDSGRVKIHIEDHSLSKEEAERLEDEIAAALEAEVIERRFPGFDGADSIEVEPHTHEEDAEEEDAEVEVQRDARQGS